MLQKLGPLDYEKLEKHVRGKELKPFKFDNGTIYVGEWDVIFSSKKEWKNTWKR